MMKKLLLSCLLLAILVGCNSKDPSGSGKNDASKRAINVPSDYFKVCMKGEDDCIKSDDVIRDSNTVKSQDPRLVNDLGNNLAYEVNHGALHIKRVVASAKFIEEGDSYAIFLVEHQIYDQDGVDTCHLCRPSLSILVYQFHNNWKLFAKQYFADIASGKFGQLMDLNPSSFIFYPAGKENFYISLVDSSFNQGIEVTTAEFFGISLNSLKNYGFLVVAYDECGNGKSDCQSWSSKIEVKRGDNGAKYIQFDKTGIAKTESSKYYFNYIPLEQQQDPWGRIK